MRMSRAPPLIHRHGLQEQTKRMGDTPRKQQDQYPHASATITSSYFPCFLLLYRGLLFARIPAIVC